ncbi:ubiquitin carboxyl-terminal hydrolase, putative [Plasmodium berghei]|uniref:ubiquitinyl hydrolase 1 n=1 Tax=Plasmodium berghei TaxID=5821 RepID=A0A1D3LQZ6_PLABE|nr:ubiquitin carboxyl-terminal hydrolase, putative [Plasmodium berghei]SCN26321.1 ubiquitin carboxyl-terminal hydrolase, putative [Plasmodium berghei]
MMNVRKRQIHVSIVNKYVDFYEENNGNSIERNALNIKKNIDGEKKKYIYQNKNSVINNTEKENNNEINSSVNWSTNNSCSCLIKEDLNTTYYNKIESSKIKKNENILLNNNDNIGYSDKENEKKVCKVKYKNKTKLFFYLIKKYPKVLFSRRSLSYYYKLVGKYNKGILDTKKYKNERIKLRNLLYKINLRNATKRETSSEETQGLNNKTRNREINILDKLYVRNEFINTNRCKQKVKKIKEETEFRNDYEYISNHRYTSINNKDNTIHDDFISKIDAKQMRIDNNSDEYYIEEKLRKYKNFQKKKKKKKEMLNKEEIFQRCDTNSLPTNYDENKKCEMMDKIVNPLLKRDENAGVQWDFRNSKGKKLKKAIKKIEKKYIINTKRAKSGEIIFPAKYSKNDEIKNMGNKNRDENNSEEIKKKKEPVHIPMDRYNNSNSCMYNETNYKLNAQNNKKNDNIKIEKRDDILDNIFHPSQDMLNYKTFERIKDNYYDENDEKYVRGKYIARLEEKEMNKKNIKTKKKSHNIDVEKEDILISSGNESDNIKTKEYLILKEIKMKQDSQKIRLNLDASCFASKGAGLYNYGQNICFFNSIIQTIVRIPYICKDLLNRLHSLNCEKKKKKEFCFYCIFEHFGYNIISKKNVIKNTLIPYIKKYICNSYNIGYQEDVHEYLRYFLCSLEKSSFFSSIYIQKMFTGVTKNVTICMNCNNVSLKYEQYYELSLDISSVNNLEEALKNFLSNEMLIGDNGYYCEKCRKKKKATKQCVINKLPRVLTIQIKRFFMNSKFNIVKNRKHISYPLCLDMKYYVNNYYLFKNSINDDVIHLYEKMMSNNKSNKNNKSNDNNFFNDNKSKIGRNDYINQNKLKEENYNNVKNEINTNNFSNFEKNENNNDSIQDKYEKYNNKDLNVLREIENIFIQLKNEIYIKLQNRHPPISSLKNLVIEKRKEIKKELNKIKYFKFYKGAILKISKDINTLYYCIKNSSEKNKKINLKTLVFKYRLDYYERKQKERENNKHEINFLNKKNSNNSEGFSNTNNYEKDKFLENKGEKNLNNNKFYQNNNHFYYELTGLIKHIGSGTDYGHYIALTKSNNNIYLQCDDNNISYVNKKDILNCAKNAYVFVYTCTHPQFIDFYNAYVDVLEKKKFDINLPVFEKRVEFRERITMPKKKFISRSLCYAIRG